MGSGEATDILGEKGEIYGLAERACKRSVRSFLTQALAKALATWGQEGDTGYSR